MVKEQQLSLVAAECSIPAYCVKTVGSRHILIGGGGGSAKTGVLNQIQIFLLSYGSQFNTKLDKYEITSTRIIGQLASSIDTAEYANMNMDCIVMNSRPDKGHYLLAVGQDQFCTLYETTGFCISQESRELTLDFKSLLRIETDKRAAGNDSYQKCVRLFHSERQQNAVKMLTAGTDGYVRLWSIEDLLEDLPQKAASSNEEGCSSRTQIPDRINATPELEIFLGVNVKMAAEEIDVSTCGQIMATVLPQSTALWDLNGKGLKLLDLPMDGGPEELTGQKFKVRSLRFTGLDRSGKYAVFVTAHNQRVRSSKEVSHLGLWSFCKGTRECRLIHSTKACKESISCLAISECSKFTAVGTMGGSVGIFDTQTLKSLLFLHETHSSFVTALVFFPHNTYDIKDLGRIGDKHPGRCFLPGICASTQAALVSTSVDRRIMVHQLPFPARSTITGSLLQLSLFSALIYLLFWAIFIYNHHHQHH